MGSYNLLNRETKCFYSVGELRKNTKLKQGFSFSLTEIALNTHKHTQEWTRTQTNCKCTLQFHGTFLLSQPHSNDRWLYLCVCNTKIINSGVHSCVRFLLAAIKKVFVSLLRELYQIHPVIEKAVCIDEPPHAGRLTFKWVCHNDGSNGRTRH